MAATELFEDISAAGVDIDILVNNAGIGNCGFTNNGFTHVRDANCVIRMRIDPPDAVTTYQHIHLYDVDKNPIDINGNIVSPKSPDAHIPIKP